MWDPAARGGPASWHHAVTLPFVLVDCPCLSWIGHHHSQIQPLQKAAHLRTVRAGFHHHSGTGIASCHGCELLASIAQTSLSGNLPGFVQHAIRVSTVTKVQSDRYLFLIPSDYVVHKASSLPTRSMAWRPPLPSHLISMEKQTGGASANWKLAMGCAIHGEPQ